MPVPGRLSALFHDADAPRASDAEVDWYDAHLPRRTGPALDAMCGSGRLLVPLLLRGLNVHGAEGSPALLERCEAKLAAAGCTTMLYRQGPASLNLPLRYAAAFIAGGAFGRVADPRAAREALSRLRAHLVGPGLLFLDLVVPAEARGRPGAPLVQVLRATLPDRGRITCRSEIVVDTDARRIDSRSRYEQRDGPAIVAREDESSALTWYDEDDIVALVAGAGFRDVAVGPSARAPDATTPDGERRFVVTARA
jgi:hypothetical protein